MQQRPPRQRLSSNALVVSCAIDDEKTTYGPPSWGEDDGQYADHPQFFRIIAENNLVVTSSRERSKPFLSVTSSRLDSGFVTTLSPERMVRLCVASVRQKSARLCGLLTKTSIENPLRLRRLKAIQSSRRVNHCFSLICTGAGRSRTPKTPRSADFESPKYSIILLLTK
jgi:hypothetical protein